MTTLLDILKDLEQHMNFIYTMEGSHPVITAENVTLSPDAITYLAHLVATTDLFIEVRKGNLIIREKING